MTIIFQNGFLSYPKQFLLLLNNVFHDGALKISIINTRLIFNNIKLVFKYLENIRCPLKNVSITSS